MTLDQPSPLCMPSLQSARATRLSAHAQAKQITQQSSEIGDERPISGCAFSPNGSMLATCGECCKRASLFICVYKYEIGDECPFSGCAFSPNGAMLAMCGECCKHASSEDACVKVLCKNYQCVLVCARVSNHHVS